MRKLDNLLVTIADIRKCIDVATHHQDEDKQTEHSNAYIRARSVASSALGQGGDRLMSAMRRVRESSRFNDKNVPLRAQVIKNLSKLEKRYENLKHKSSDEDYLDVSDLELAIHKVVLEKSRMTGLPVEEPCFDDHDELEEANCDGCKAWDGYYEEINKLLRLVEIRNSGLVTLYNPITASKVVINTDSADPADWSLDDLHPVGLIIEVRALDWMIENKMTDPLRNILGNVIVTKW